MAGSASRVSSAPIAMVNINSSAAPEPEQPTSMMERIQHYAMLVPPPIQRHRATVPINRRGENIWPLVANLWLLLILAYVLHLHFVLVEPEGGEAVPEAANVDHMRGSRGGLFGSRAELVCEQIGE
ncbi:hypothetical protein BS50DRAFT_120993 [Corynespora cassiicola Philippines]|uniref:Uncharacterized protein n=1 Tax=Corynespora cassiicola Philippines TaxID=1448308 RepID=A0A2T2NAN6_CORCC|nr:hypothetical protein BS50DRAFT_120993 [Corynespora cassiicola Philippines]